MVDFRPVIAEELTSVQNVFLIIWWVAYMTFTVKPNCTYDVNIVTYSKAVVLHTQHFDLGCTFVWFLACLMHGTVFPPFHSSDWYTIYLKHQCGIIKVNKVMIDLGVFVWHICLNMFMPQLSLLWNCEIQCSLRIFIIIVTLGDNTKLVEWTSLKPYLYYLH